jgi:hypothetical protein
LAILVFAAAVLGVGYVLSGSNKDDEDTSLHGPTSTPAPRRTVEVSPTNVTPTDTPLPEATEVPPSNTPVPPTSAPAGQPTVAPATPTTGPAAVNCSTPLQDTINAAAAGASLDLSGCSYNGAIRIDKPLTLVGGKLTLAADSQWTQGIVVNSDGVTIQGWQISGGGNVIAVLGRSNVRISNNTFDGQVGSAIALWGEGRGSNNVTISGNRISQTRTSKVSPIIGRASENCSVFSYNLTVSGNTMDQGQGNLGWFGLELKCHDGVVIQGNTFSGGQTLVSLPDSRNVTIRANTFNLSGSPYWGVEVPKATNVSIEGNTFNGDGADGGDHGVSINSGSLTVRVVGNNFRNLRTALDTTGDNITLTDNCLSNVLNLTEYEHPAPYVNRVEQNNVSCG